MSYTAGENVLDHSYCEADIVRSAKSNVRFFIEIILIPALLILAVWGIIGSISCIGGCLGCEACVETAACLDSCSMKKGCDNCKASCEQTQKDCEEYYNGDIGFWEQMTTDTKNCMQGNGCAGENADSESQEGTESSSQENAESGSQEGADGE